MDDLLTEVEGFIAFFGVPASRLGRGAVGDPAFVTGLRLGREPRRDTVQRVRAWMAQERVAAAGAAAPPKDPAGAMQDGPAWIRDGV